MAYKKRTCAIIMSILIGLSVAYLVCHRFFYSSSAPRDWPEIAADSALNIVTEYNLVDYYVSGDSIAGMQYELCKYIEKRSGLKVNIFLENSLKTCIQKLENKTYDVIALNIPVTNEGKKTLAFTVPIAHNKQVLIQRKPIDSKDRPLIRNQIELGRKTIFVPKNSPCILRLRNLSEEIAEPIYIKELDDYTQEQILYMVAYRQIDYAVVDKKIALKNKTLFPGIDINTDISFTQLQAWAVRKDSPLLLDSLNRWISALPSLP
ncbi:MAG: transporter substrate-binding domain-containing protein [Candidatus Azobacteroides sp.]|nr:transporter substrate-binding domain-containing protein [Candidatus Azobacteroides sp.]